MWTLRRSAACTTAVGCALMAAAAAAAQPVDGHNRDATRLDGSHRELSWDRGPRDTPPGSFVGVNGKTYQSAPLAVYGHHGTVYFGEEMDEACADGGPRFAQALQRLGKLAAVIERSGRHVV